MKKIKIYSISTCNHCRCAKDLLSRHGAEFECEDLDLANKDRVASLLEEVRRLNSRCSFPTILIGETVIVGCKEELIKEALEND